MITPRASMLLIALAAPALFAAHAAHASDFSHECHPASGQYEINDDALFEKGGNGRQIPYTTVREHTIAEKRGTCVSTTGAVRGRYTYNFRQYLKVIRFREGGSQTELTFLCELSSSGLPAAANCDRDQVTLDYVAIIPPGPTADRGGSPGETVPRPRPSGAASLWDHNGSVMRLEAGGSQRRFVYDQPRSGLASVGVRSGTILFSGDRRGNRYDGVAYIFTRNCGEFGFPVAGDVGPGETTVTLRGQAPRIGSDCRPTGYRAETLIFTLMR
ncbi:MAG: hypothetical protein ACFCUN_03400 [Hyphomicrobiaceae bacterium]